MGLGAHPQSLDLGALLRAGREELHAKLLPRRQPARHHDAVVRAIRCRHTDEIAAINTLRHGDREPRRDRPDGHAAVKVGVLVRCTRLLPHCRWHE